MKPDDAAGKPLGFWMCTALIVGNVIGMGMFMLPASLAPYGLNTLLGWGVTIFGCVFIAYTFANFARAMPGEDGPYGYMRRAFGNGMAFFIMWCYWVSLWITNATLAVGVAGYLAALFPGLAGMPLLPPAVALCLIWLFVLVSTRGAHASGRVQMVSTVLKLLPMLAVMVLGAYLLVVDAHLYVAHVPTTPLSFQASAAAGTIALFAMLGVESATLSANKVARPEYTLPRATMVGTLITALVYICVSAIPLLLIPQAELAASNAPLADLFNRYLGAGSGKWLAVFVVISGLGALNGWTMITGAVTESFASHHVFPAVFKRVNRHGAPVTALVFTGLLASGMVLMNYSRSLAQGFTFLSVMVTAATLPLYLIGGLAMIKLWKRGVVQGKSALLLFCAVMSTVFSVWAFYGMGQEAFYWSVVLGAVSLPVFYGMRHWRKSAAVAQVLT
jgi:APA family basic amino acid/polyamine antiporter